MEHTLAFSHQIGTDQVGTCGSYFIDVDIYLHLQGVFFSLDSVRGLSISYFKEFQAVFVHFA